jgi:hypothetical protein
VLRLAYVLGAGYVALCSLLVARRQPAAPAPVIVEAPPAASGGWFAAVRPRCNAVEVALAMSSMPPPRGQEGYQASCYALAGKIDEARRILASLPPGERGHATEILFEVVHPVADAGDDRSAGPMMRLVLEHWPDNYMALYHAGMSEYAVGEYPRAQVHLRRFLELYRADDGWTGNARSVLARPEMH